MRRRTLLLWPILVAAVLGLAVLAVRGPLGWLARPCLFRAWTGVPCPTCGGVRATRLLLEPSLGEALRANPFIAAAYLALAASALAALLLLPWAHRIAVPSARVRRRAWIAALLLLGLSWLSMIVR
jgi:hypothetical protein